MKILSPIPGLVKSSCLKSSCWSELQKVTFWDRRALFSKAFSLLPGAASAAGAPGKASSAGKIKYSPGGTFIELADATTETGGAKAAACGEIAYLAESSSDG